MKKAAIVTGASSGIGAATALEFSKNGYFIFLAGRDESRLSEVALQCSHGASLLKIDFLKPETIEKYAKHLYERPDVQIEVLINNAGIYEKTPVAEANIELWRKMFEVNLFGAVALTQKVLPHFKKNKNGCIINVASTLGLRPTPDVSAYSASKAAMINWTQSLALELGSDGIRVNCVCPGIVDTPIHAFHKQSPDEKQKALTSLGPLQPLGRVGSAIEVAKSIYFLGSDESSWTTGAILNVDGGINLK